MNQLITPASLVQDADIIESIRTSLLFEQPGAAIEADEPRFLDVQDILDPLRPSSAMQDVIAVRWKERLSRLTTFQRRLRQNARWRAVEGRFLELQEELTRGCFSASDPRRKVSAKVAAYLSDEEMRAALVTEVDQVTMKETLAMVSRAVKNGGRLDGYELMIVGVGIIGADAALVLQAFAAGRVLQIEAEPQRGGTFRSLASLATELPAFETNSRDIPPTPYQRARGGLELTNSFFDQAPVQPAALTRSAFLGSHLLGAAAAINSYLAGPALVGGRVLLSGVGF